MLLSQQQREVTLGFLGVYLYLPLKNVTLAAIWRIHWLGRGKEVNISRPFKRHKPLGWVEGYEEK